MQCERQCCDVPLSQVLRNSRINYFCLQWDNFESFRDLVCALYLRNCCDFQIALSFLLELTSTFQCDAAIPTRAKARVRRFPAASRNGELCTSMRAYSRLFLVTYRLNTSFPAHHKSYRPTLRYRVFRIPFELYHSSSFSNRDDFNLSGSHRTWEMVVSQRLIAINLIYLISIGINISTCLFI